MAELVADCPRCGATRVGFVAFETVPVKYEYNWKYTLEAFAICRNCKRSTVFVLGQSGTEDTEIIRLKGIRDFSDSLNNHFRINGYISLKDESAVEPPEYLPATIETVFREGATCLAVGCFNAAGVMFRMCVDIATRDLLPPAGENGPNEKQRRDLGLRLPWLFDHGRLPEGLRDLSACVHQDGNDGAHQGTLTEDDAADLIDFTTALLERLYTEPERLRLAAARRAERRTRPRTATD